MQDYTYTTTGNDASSAAFLGAFLVGYLVFIVVIYLITSFVLSKVFTKAGQPAWAAFVPIYNGWVLFEIGGKPGWWVLSSFIPLIGPLIAVILYIIISLELAKRFGKSSTFGIIGLWLFSIIGFAILAFDNSKYQGEGVSAATRTTPKKPETLNNTNTTKKDKDTPPSPPLVQ